MNLHAVLLFSFDFLQVAFVSNYNENDHILLQEQTPGTFKVIKQAKSLKNLFEIIERLKIIPICYSNKKYEKIQPILSKVNQNLKWTYINVEKNNCRNIYPNHSKLFEKDNILIIQYGQGFSICEGKEQLRIAVCAALKIGFEESKKRFIIYQNNTQQILKLKQNGYMFIYCNISDQQANKQLEIQVQKIQKNLQQEKNQQFIEFVQKSPKFDCQYIQKIAGLHFFENKKNIVPSVGLGNIPIYRLPKSQSISAVVFRYLGDKQIYIAKAEGPSKIGGDLEHQSQQNKVLVSTLYQTLSKIEFTNSNKKFEYLCLPTYLSHFMIRHSLIKAYNKNKGYYIVQPYVNGLKIVSDILKFDQQKQIAIKLAQQGAIQGKLVSGLGRIIALSLICNEQFNWKGLLETISIFYFQRKQPNLKEGQFICLCIRTSIMPCFKKLKSIKKVGNIEDIQVKLLSNPNTNIKLSNLCKKYQQQIRQTLNLICETLPIIQSVFKYYFWNFNKTTQFKNFVQNLQYYCQIFKVKETDSNGNFLQYFQRLDIQKINPSLLNYLVASKDQLFQYFTKPSSDKQYSLTGFNFDDSNLYTKKINQLQNFVIYGQAVPVMSLMRWIRSQKPGLQITYLSLFNCKVENYIKLVKIAKTQKKNVLFIVDYCQLQQGGVEIPEGKSILDTNWGIRTIFIYRLKLGSCRKLMILHDPLTNSANSFSAFNSKLPNSHQQIFNTIFRFMKNFNDKQNLFQNYKNAIQLFIKNKWVNIGKKPGIFDIQIIHNTLKKLVKAISLKNNRLYTFLKDKEFFGRSQGLQPGSSRTTNTQLIDTSETQSLVSLEHLQKIPRVHLILYYLPIFISNQRIWLMHDIHEYLSAYYLYNDIMQQTWDGNLDGEQLQHFINWYPTMKSQDKINSNLLSLLNKFQTQKLTNKQDNHVMGGYDSFGDCLELIKKLGNNKIFCKLDGMFYLDSQLIEMYKLQNEVYIVLSSKGTIYKIHPIKKADKQQWKTQILYQNKNKQNIDLYYCYAGLKIINIQQSQKKVIMSFSWVNMNKNKNRVNIKDNMIQTKNVRIDGKQLNIYKSKVNINIIIQKFGNCIVKLLIIQQLFYVFVLENGQVLITRIIFQQKDNSFQIISVIQMQNLASQISKQGKKLPKFQEIKIYYYAESDSKIKFAISAVRKQKYCNQPANFIKSQQNDIDISKSQSNIAYFQIFYDNIKNTAFFENQSVIFITYPHLLESFRVNISKDNAQVIAFVKGTGSVAIWTIQVHKQNNNKQILRQPSRRFYRIENEPCEIYKFENILFVGSRYNFVKRMLINSQSN